MKRESSRSDVCIVQGNKESIAVSQLLTTPTVVAYLQREDVVAENTNGSSADVGCDARGAYVYLQASMMYVCMLNNATLQRVIGVVEQSSEDIRLCASAVISTLPYSILWISWLSIFEHGQLSL